MKLCEMMQNNMKQRIKILDHMQMIGSKGLHHCFNLIQNEVIQNDLNELLQNGALQ